jgi:hypothetical protein
MGLLYDTLVDLAPERDPELLDGYQRYEAQLATILTPVQMDTYATYIHQRREIPVFDAMTPNELANLPLEIQEIARDVLADTTIAMENRRVAALLHQRGEDDVAGDL